MAHLITRDECGSPAQYPYTDLLTQGAVGTSAFLRSLTALRGLKIEACTGFLSKHWRKEAPDLIFELEQYTSSQYVSECECTCGCQDFDCWDLGRYYLEVVAK